MASGKAYFLHHRESDYGGSTRLVVHRLCLLFAGAENYPKLYPSILFSVITPLLLVFLFGFVVFAVQDFNII